MFQVSLQLLKHFQSNKYLASYGQDAHRMHVGLCMKRPSLLSYFNQSMMCCQQILSTPTNTQFNENQYNNMMI